MNQTMIEQLALIRCGAKFHRVMLITGKAGRGKSFMSRAVKRWADFGMRSYLAGGDKPVSVELVRTYIAGEPFNSLCSLFSTEAGFGDSTERATERICELIRTRLLIIDDLGNEKNPPPTFEPGLASVIEQRWDKHRPTWVITNLTQDQMQQRYGDRLFSRIWNAAKIVPVTGRDRRIK